MNFEQMKEVIDKKITEALELNLQNYQNGVKNTNQYKVYLMQKRQICHVYIQPEKIEDTFKEMFTLHQAVKKVQLYEIEYEYDGSCYDGRIEYVSLEYTAYELMPYQSIEQFDEHLYFKIFKIFMAEEIQEEKSVFGFTLDCKLLQLFKDGVIDYETLKNISLANCGI